MKFNRKAPPQEQEELHNVQDRLKALSERVERLRRTSLVITIRSGKTRGEQR